MHNHIDLGTFNRWVDCCLFFTISSFACSSAMYLLWGKPHCVPLSCLFFAFINKFLALASSLGEKKNI